MRTILSSNPVSYTHLDVYKRQSLLGSMGGAGDKKINPATLLNVMKTLSSAESSGGDSKNSGKSDEKKKD